jgi:peptidoglycan hydrolase-like protein with peptidoglycan-binding domain
VALLVLAVVIAVAAAAVLWSGATLATDPTALARIDLQPFAGKLEQASATDASGHPIALVHQGTRLTPRALLTPGQTVVVDVVVKRPGWIGWALGKERRERLTVHAPVAHVENRWVTAQPGRRVSVKFNTDLAAAGYGTGLRRRAVSGSTLSLPASSPAGATEVAAAPRSWERLGPPVRVSWFPAAHAPVALADPAPGTKIAPSAELRLTLSKPINEALRSKLPRVTPATQGRWRRIDSHTLAFQPSGFGAPMGSTLNVELPRRLAVATASGRGLSETSRIRWTVRPASILRLHQLLAQAGYLPVTWSSNGADVAHTPAAEAAAAVDPPRGTFSWRYPNTPSELRGQWSAGQATPITRGAVMKFQDTHHLTVDAVAGPAVWKALLADVLAGKRNASGYSYVYVHRNLPQQMTLWHNGRVVLRSPGNTGVPSAPTKLGTFQVFEHIAQGTMSGTNPDGSHYNDPGIKWISYFNGGDALHAFPRASFGTPQSLGCVELPLAAAAKVWPYTPIGTLVTIEN